MQVTLFALRMGRHISITAILLTHIPIMPTYIHTFSFLAYYHIPSSFSLLLLLPTCHRFYSATTHPFLHLQITLIHTNLLPPLPHTLFCLAFPTILFTLPTTTASHLPLHHYSCHSLLPSNAAPITLSSSNTYVTFLLHHSSFL